jgi:hypothetical protein
MARATLTHLLEHQLTVADVQALGPDILAAATIPCPADTMFRNEIRMAAFKVLAKYRFREGIQAGVVIARTQGGHGSETRTGEIMKELTGYGAAASGIVPDLEDLIEFFNAECAAGGFPEGPLNDARIDAVKAAIEPMSRKTVYAGVHGSGQAAKICNNMLLGISMLGTCEAFALAERLGLDAARFFEIVSGASGQCWSVTTYCPVPGVGPASPSDRGFEGGFATNMMLKDLKLAQEAAARFNGSTPLGALAEAQYALFSSLGYGDKDFSAFIELLSGRLGPRTVEAAA